jgi:hypothetical protein
MQHKSSTNGTKAPMHLRKVASHKQGRVQPQRPSTSPMPTYEETRSRVRAFLENPHVLALK